MKTLSNLVLSICLAAVSNIVNAFHPHQWPPPPPRTFQNRRRPFDANQQQRRAEAGASLSLATQNDDDKVPHPPDASPPFKLLKDNMFFATPCNPEEDEECEVNGENGANTSGYYLADMVDKEKMQEAAVAAGEFVKGLAVCFWSHEIS
jgi:hypothetical protein